MTGCDRCKRQVDVVTGVVVDAVVGAADNNVVGVVRATHDFVAGAVHAAYDIVVGVAAVVVTGVERVVIVIVAAANFAVVVHADVVVVTCPLNDDENVDDGGYLAESGVTHTVVFSQSRT